MRFACAAVVLGIVAACSTTDDPIVEDRSATAPSGGTHTPPGAPPSGGSGSGSAPTQEADSGASSPDNPPGTPPPPIDDAGVPPPPPPPPPDQCSAVVQVAAQAIITNHVGSYDRTQLTGGAIADGTYVLTGVTDYVEPGHVDGQMSPYGRDTLVVHGGVIDDVFEWPAGGSVRFTAAFTVSGSTMRTTTSCTWAEMPNAHFPATGDWATLEHEDNSYGATPSSITIWTPRGNHESVVRVFARQP
ncbi:MAG TPA: hypothetical protein VIF62_35165 [Labilithrix sp.]|jgi:hypothetical protein